MSPDAIAVLASCVLWSAGFIAHARVERERKLLRRATGPRGRRSGTLRPGRSGDAPVPTWARSRRFSEKAAAATTGPGLAARIQRVLAPLAALLVSVMLAGGAGIVLWLGSGSVAGVACAVALAFRQSAAS